MNDSDKELVEYLLKTGWAIVETKIDDTDQAQIVYFRKNGNRDLVFTIEPEATEDPLTLY